ncbi:MAG: ATP-grasp domain-containing protein, partial [Chloroflexi bacterium]|nr:ATP-grasp domain-containing protein [Chloroflexota bacterium]
EARAKLKSIEADVIFNLFEGFAGDPQTEPAIAHFLPELGIPYTGCPGNAISLALDKPGAKALLAAAGIETPAWQKLSPATLPAFRLPFPCIVKPCAEDASHGIWEESVVYDFPALERQVAKLSHLFGEEVLVEEYIDGREFNTTVMGNTEPTVLAISEIVYTLPPGLPRILTFHAKWDEGTIYCEGTKNVCPAEISPETHAAIADAALRAFKCMGCAGYARVDFRMDIQGKVTVLEVNPNPDISPDVGAARQARAAGFTYAGFIERIVQLALEQRSPIKT